MHDFNYLRPKSLADAVAAFKNAGDGRYLAGGQTMIPVMKQRLASPSDVIDLSQVPELKGIAVNGGIVAIGAMTSHAEVAASKDVQAAIPALADLASGIGDPHVRNRGTIGGSIANNDPAADYPTAVVGLNATVVTDRRRIAADDFFTGMFGTALEEGELVTRVEFPKPEAAAYEKFLHPASRFALVGVFVARTKSGVRVAVTGAGPCVFRETVLEQALTRTFAANAVKNIDIDASNLNSDIHGSAEYRAHLVGVLAARAVAKAR
ncbi:MAG: xanthine dehydrogenase family protein subunit M [Rhodospirillales bacterium]|nr:xanthine dehydrogenase family protein subunit M [Rhodospirillales bacterium]